MTPNPSKPNYRFGEPTEFKIAAKMPEGFSGEVELVVPIPSKYGGTLRENEEPVLQVKEENAFMNIAKTKEEAKKQMGTYEQKDDNSDPFDIASATLGNTGNIKNKEVSAQDSQKSAMSSDRRDKLKAKYKTELEEKEKFKEKAKLQIKEFMDKKMKEAEGRKGKNLKDQESQLKDKKSLNEGKNPWEKVLANVELKSENYLGTKDVTRMRQAMISRKNDIKQGIIQVS